MTPVLSPPHRDLTFMTPLSPGSADRLVAFLAGGRPATVVDIGCGWAELLVRVLAEAPQAQGLGIDLDGDAIRHGQDLAAQRGLSERVDLVEGDAREVAPGRSDSLLCIGASQVWGSDVEEREPLDYASALRALRTMLVPGGRLVYGEGIWSAAPTPAATAPLAGRADEFVSLVELLDIAEAEGFMPMQVHEATLAEWDEFESGYAACYARWLAEHPSDHPDVAAVRESAARQRAAYFGGYRGVLGMAYLSLVAV